MGKDVAIYYGRMKYLLMKVQMQFQEGPMMVSLKMMMISVLVLRRS